jgi:hypothetical protein
MSALVPPSKAAALDPTRTPLGMKFVRFPHPNGSNPKQFVLFSVWETRVRDYVAFAKAEEAAGRDLDRSWKTADFASRRWIADRRTQDPSPRKRCRSSECYHSCRRPRPTAELTSEEVGVSVMKPVQLGNDCFKSMFAIGDAGANKVREDWLGECWPSPARQCNRSISNEFRNSCCEPPAAPSAWQIP